MRFRCEYKYHKPFTSPRHSWTIIGALGGIHVHISVYAKEGGRVEHSGGIEVHYRTPPDYMRKNAPSQDKCWLIGCPCWHDGSSLYVSERVIPFWECAPHDHERMFKFLESEYVSRFEGGSDEAE